MYDYSVKWRHLDPEEETFPSRNAREAAALFLTKHGGSFENYGRTLHVKCTDTGEETFWASIRTGKCEATLFQTDERGDVINDFPTINEILRRHNLPEINVDAVDINQILFNRDLARWAEKVTVKAVNDDSTCELCNAHNGRLLGDLLRVGSSGPPFHDENDERGPCRCTTFGPSPLSVHLNVLMRAKSEPIEIDLPAVPLD